MNKQGFRNLLESVGLNKRQVGEGLAIAEKFDAFLSEPGRVPSADTAWAFSRQLIDEGNNIDHNYIDLMRYSRFIKNNEMFVAFLELLDGGEVGGNLYDKVGKKFGHQVREEIFNGIGVAPYGTPSPEKPAYLQPVIERLEARVGHEACRDFLSASLRDLPDADFLSQKEKYRQAGSMDAYLRQRKEAFLARLEECQRQNSLFFAQEITPEVLDLVRRDPEMGGGRREGNVIYETKIPYMAQKYLAETDPTMKRYYACHCPWARDAIKNGNVKLANIFCQCSGGFHKKAFEAIFEQILKVDVLESAIRGDIRCRFAIYLPEG